MKTLLLLLILPLAVFAQPVVGDPAPDFTLPDTAGNPISLSDFTGDIVLLNFFATWCVPCQIEAPQLEDSIWQVYRQQGVTVFALDFQEPVDPLKTFINQHQLTFPIARDTAGAVASLYGMQILPTNILINRSGHIAWMEGGFDIPKMIHLIDSLLAPSEINKPGDAGVPPQSLTLLGSYPNPFNSQTNIQITLREAGSIRLQIFSITGQKLSNRKMWLAQGNHSIPVQMPTRASGIYFFTLNFRNENRMGRLILQK